MKATTFFTSAAFLASSVLSAPAPAPQTTYPAPPGGWESVKYPPGTGEGLPSYPAPPGGWENVKYPPGTGAGAPARSVFQFTSTYFVKAVGSEVRNGTTPAPGPADAEGWFNFGINSHSNTICYNITLINVKGEYQSPARTATHIHEAARGASGPPRIAFPNPVGDDSRRVSYGCLTGPFVTGLNGANGKDNGDGFHVSQIEKNPAGFFADSHTRAFSLGVVRGQLA